MPQRDIVSGAISKRWADTLAQRLAAKQRSSKHALLPVSIPELKSGIAAIVATGSAHVDTAGEAFRDASHTAFRELTTLGGSGHMAAQVSRLAVTFLTTQYPSAVGSAPHVERILAGGVTHACRVLQPPEAFWLIVRQFVSYPTGGKESAVWMVRQVYPVATGKFEIECFSVPDAVQFTEFVSGHFSPSTRRLIEYGIVLHAGPFLYGWCRCDSTRLYLITRRLDVREVIEPEKYLDAMTVAQGGR